MHIHIQTNRLSPLHTSLSTYTYTHNPIHTQTRIARYHQKWPIITPYHLFPPITPPPSPPPLPPPPHTHGKADINAQVRPLARLEMRPVCGNFLTSRHANTLSLAVTAQVRPLTRLEEACTTDPGTPTPSLAVTAQVRPLTRLEEACTTDPGTPTPSLAVSAQDKQGMTAAHEAAYRGHSKLYQQLAGVPGADPALKVP